MALDEEKVKGLFEREVANLCQVLGFKEKPKYAFRLSSHANSRVHWRLARSPLVEIGIDYAENPYALAAEAAHVVFNLARKRLGLRHVPAYGEVFDYFNQVRRMHENGETAKAKEYRQGFKSMDAFITELERVIMERPQENRIALNSPQFEKITRVFTKQMERYGGETIDHMAAMGFIRLAFNSGLKEPRDIGRMLRSIIQRDSQYGNRMLMGDYQGLLEEFEFFRREPKRIMQSQEHRQRLERPLPFKKKKGLLSRFRRRK